MIKGQESSTLGHSTASSQIKSSYAKPNKQGTPPFSTHIALSNATRPVYCKVSNKGTALTSKLVAKASKTVDSWLSEDLDFSDFYNRNVEGNKDRSSNETMFKRWNSHRSSSRYVRHMLGIFKSQTVKSLMHPLLSTAGVATVVCFYEDLLREGVFPDYFSSFMMPTAPFDLTSFALALLLVFRTNTSYDRWLEVGMVWSGLANRARDTMRQVVSHLSDANGAMSPLAGAMCRWVVAYSRSLKAELVEGCNLEEELSKILTSEELKQLMAAHHRPSFAISVLTELAATAPLRESHRIRMDENFTYFEDAVGTCERILRTPIPLSYTRHTSRFMVIWLSALPLGLYESCGWATIPLAVVIGFLLLGIDSIGVFIEEPFRILPLNAYCDEVEDDLFSMLKEAVVTKKDCRCCGGCCVWTN
ncbi:hypothetical protein Ndes2526B_g03917 [Nannochloris sp. 'desiccata']